ncbi:MAG: glycosyl transferase group 1 [Actinomycetia bacterium]|nr:glycosyl transferase group 1 [Actinomycetes bacterium]
MTRVDQLLPRLAGRDAVGAHTLAVQDALRATGIESDVFAAEWDADVAGRVRTFDEYSDYSDADDAWLMYHASVGSHVGGWFAERTVRKLVDYHNVTPHEFFDAWAPEISGLLVSGRHQLEDLAPLARAGLADSHFNELDMRTAGFAPTAVVPIMVDVRRSVGVVDEQLLDGLGATKRGADWVFVGRVAPNKAQHELIKAFALYRHSFDPGARLWVVGGESSALYRAALDRFVTDLDLANAVVLTGSVSDAELGAYYEAADMFVCVSRHEGFCVPVLEAMAHSVPVVALASTAVPETVGDAAALVPENAPLHEVAAAVWRVASDAPTRRALIEAGHRRVEHFSVERSSQVLLDAISTILGRNA